MDGNRCNVNIHGTIVQIGITMSITVNTERKGEVIIFHYRICNDENKLPLQKLYLGPASEDMTSGRTTVVDSGWSETVGGISDFCLLDRRRVLADMMMKKDRF